MADPFHGVLAQDQREDHALNQTPSQRHVAGDLSDLASSRFALILLQIFQLRDGTCQQLENDRGIDEGQDPQGEHPEGGDSTAREDVQETQQGTSLVDEAGEGCTINPRNGDVDPETHQQQQTQGGEHPIAQAGVADQLTDDFSGVGVAAPTDEHGQEVWGGLNTAKPPVDRSPADGSDHRTDGG